MHSTSWIRRSARWTGWTVAEAWRCVEEARRRDPGLVELAPMRACIAWLRAELGDEAPTDGRLAELFVRVPGEVRAGRVDRPRAARIDEFLALARARAGALPLLQRRVLRHLSRCGRLRRDTQALEPEPDEPLLAELYSASIL